MTSPVKQWRRQKEKTNLIGKKGEILSWTIIRVAGRAFVDQMPYPVVIIRLSDNEQMIGQLVDWEKDDLFEGKKVRIVLRRSTENDTDGIVNYLIKFKPI